MIPTLYLAGLLLECDDGKTCFTPQPLAHDHPWAILQGQDRSAEQLWHSAGNDGVSSRLQQLHRMRMAFEIPCALGKVWNPSDEKPTCAVRENQYPQW